MIKYLQFFGFSYLDKNIGFGSNLTLSLITLPLQHFSEWNLSNVLCTTFNSTTVPNLSEINLDKQNKKKAITLKFSNNILQKKNYTQNSIIWKH